MLINQRIAQLEQMRTHMIDLMHAKEHGTPCPRQKAATHDFPGPVCEKFIMYHFA